MQPTAVERVQRFYRFHAYIYDSTRWTILFGRRQAAQRLGLRPDSHVLEIGCGTGLNFRYILEHLDPRAGELVGVDFSPHMLSRAARRVAAHGWPNVELLERDATTLDLGRRFDAILFGYSIALIPDWPTALLRARDHLRPAGRLVMLEFGQFERWGLVGRIARAWLRHNHVETLQPYPHKLREMFDDVRVNHWLGGYNFIAEARKGSAQ